MVGFELEFCGNVCIAIDEFDTLLSSSYRTDPLCRRIARVSRSTRDEVHARKGSVGELGIVNRCARYTIGCYLLH